jgi:4,5-DOPA dioxygenase extradiol
MLNSASSFVIIRKARSNPKTVMTSALSFIRSLVSSRYSIVLLSGLSIALIHHTTKPSPSHLNRTPKTSMTSVASSSPGRTPVYFLSIGGPNFIENVGHPAYAKLAEIGEEITKKVKPKAVVVLSAHWQGGADTIKVNVGEHMDIIYDFYGFPAHYYEHKFPNKGSKEVAEGVAGLLGGARIKTERVERGLDHGIWAGFMAGKS